MRVALITTTINVPHVLALYHECSIRCGAAAVRFFVALDKKTPVINDLVCKLGNCETCNGDRYKISPFLGWNTITRRNIALLEALKWGADLIVTSDDDNYPLSTDYFERFLSTLTTPFSGLQVAAPFYLFDPGSLAFPRVCQRGFPQQNLSHNYISSIANARVGVATGMVLGDPDTSAVDRLSQHPVVHQVSELARAGVVINNKAWTVFNSQNTCFTRELAPCFLMVPAFGRYDDIFASLIAQRVMRAKNLYLHIGQPFVWQQRNPHDLVQDLKAEMWGMEHVMDFALWMDGLDLRDLSVIDVVRMIWSKPASFIPDGVAQLAAAWLDDLGTVL